MAESFFATLKTEFYHRRVWPTKVRAKLEVGAWNRGPLQPPPQALLIGQVSPVAFEVQYSNQTAGDQQTAQLRVHRPG